MLSFLRAQSFEDPELGRFKRVRTTWFPVPPSTGLCVTMEGGNERPLPEVVEVARTLMQAPESFVQAASAFVSTSSHALEFIKGNGELTCDGFTVHQTGSFAVEFSLSDWPDAMITVWFEEGSPCKLTLGD